MDTQPQTHDPYALAARLSGQHLIDGRMVPSVSGATFEILDPATGKVMGHAAKGDGTDVDAAVAAALRAQQDWARMPARKRGELVAACGRKLAENAEEIARLMALETGKALRTESRVEAGVLADVFVFYGGLGSELKGETVPFNPDMLTVTMREPIGVVGAIIPWNVPLMLMALKIAPAMVAGNTVIVKSAEEAPLTVLRAAEIINQVLPPGVMNLLSGFGPDCGGRLVAHPKVGKITFTGSVETGRIVTRTASDKLIPVTLELGGKSPMLIMADADLDRAVAGAVSGMRFTRQGQSCTASSRIYVHEDLHDAFVQKLTAAVDKMVMGDPLDEATDIGAIISPEQFTKVKRYIELGESIPGTTTHRLSRMPEDPRLKDGLFVQPVVFTDIPADSPPAREEIFGPVACVFRWNDYEEVLAAANNSEYGLAATVWTSNLHTALDATRRLDAGFVQVNQNLVVQANLSYGGNKSSGLGREASLEAMLEHFTQKKTIIFNMT
ncbi:MAG: aldehyde dehydrogenase family protein [Rhodospirillaceae bacterium]|nr:aldehyde dehydrogenase family protein [Rhodospirillaceae bacterium]